MYSKVKRGIDLVLSLVLLAVLLPAFAIILVLIRLDSPGNGLFIQRRIGRGGCPFFIYKFRTMYTSAPHDVAASALCRPERYITRIGRFLRRTSLDELPQLINVFKGDMSLIGPRPVVPSEQYLLALRRADGADCIRPGITGLAQVRGRDTLAPREKARYDSFYAQHLSLRLDLHIFWLTLRCLIADRHTARPLS